VGDSATLMQWRPKSHCALLWAHIYLIICQIVQVGRTGRPSGADADALSTLLAGSPGVCVSITAADAASTADGAAVWGCSAPAGAAGVRVVVHASGVLADAALARQTYGGLKRCAATALHTEAREHTVSCAGPVCYNNIFGNLQF
jgi:hypothetical protein